MSDSTSQASTASLPYPLFINLDDARIVVIGAGKVASRKIETLLEYGARPTVIAPVAEGQILELAAQGRVEYLDRGYVPGDLEGALLAIAATSDGEVNEAVAAEAKKRCMLVNVVDVPELCNCIVPSILRRGQLQVAVSTGGASPCAARDLRLELEEVIPQWWEAYLACAAKTRALVKERVPGPASEREPMMRKLGSPEFRELFAAGQRPTPEEAYALLGEDGGLAQ